VWASDAARHVVVEISELAKRRISEIRVPGEPTRVAADEHAVWVVLRTPHASLVRIDPDVRRVVAVIPLPIVPKRVAIGAGAVWVTGYRWSDHVSASRDGEILRIDPRTNRIVARIHLGDVAADGVLVADGRVWVAVPPSA